MNAKSNLDYFIWFWSTAIDLKYMTGRMAHYFAGLWLTILERRFVGARCLRAK
jgi:hypothetical protein